MDNKKKYIICLGDGMADEPCDQLNGLTPLQKAATPNMDFMVKFGKSGKAKITPEGFYPGSDVANMAILGYEPKKYYTGRGPIEAASMGITAPKDQIIFRCNLCALSHAKDGLENAVMASFTAEHISSKEADILLNDLERHLNDPEVKFFTGVSYRHILLLSRNFEKLNCTAPHDITDKCIKDYLPTGSNDHKLLILLEKAHVFLSKHPINLKRLKQGKKMANMIWPWSQGAMPSLPSFEQKYGLNAMMITAVDLLKGLGKLSGMTVPDIPGATGFIDTNYDGKVQAAIQALKEHDFIYLHVEAPDEAGHMGDAQLKTKAIEDFDKKILGPLLKAQKKNQNLILMVLPDHPTPCHLKTHTHDDVPAVIYSHGHAKNGGRAYNEKEVAAHHWTSASDLLNDFLLK